MNQTYKTISKSDLIVSAPLSPHRKTHRRTAFYMIFFVLSRASVLSEGLKMLSRLDQREQTFIVLHWLHQQTDKTWLKITITGDGA